MSEIRATIVIYCEKTQAAQQTWCICRRRCGTANTVSFWTKASGGSGVRWFANGSFAVRGRNESESLVSGICGGNHYIVFRFETDGVGIVHVQSESDREQGSLAYCCSDVWPYWTREQFIA